MKVDEEDIGFSLRVSGRLYSVDRIIDQTHNALLSPTQMSKVGANFLAILLVVCMNLLGYKHLAVGWVIASLFVHEFGHYLGMILTRSSKASFTIGVFGPVTLGAEGLSAGRKSMVALAGSMFGLLVAVSLTGVNHVVGVSELKQLVDALVFVSALNLLPIKPFDGYTVVDHLVFLRHPKIQLTYLILAGLLVFAAFIRSMNVEKHALYSFVFIGLLGCMFGGAKKADNMADMVVRLRKEGAADFGLGRYQPDTVKRMEFSLNLFDVENEFALAGLLREIWDQAWEEPAVWSEVIIILAMYILMLVSCTSMPIMEQICSAIF